MSTPREPVFLERQSYRRRRLSDAARLLPIVGLLLLLLPLLWASRATTAGGIVFIFSVWAILIVLTGLISRRLSEFEPFDAPGEAAESVSKKDGGAR